MSRCLLVVGGANRPLPYIPSANGPGVSAFEIETATGEWWPRGVLTGLDNPTYLAPAPDGRMLAATSEVFEWREGLVSLIRFDPQGGQLAYVNQQPTRGDTAAQSCFDPTSRWLATVNYGMLPTRPGRSLAIYPLTAAGELGPVIVDAVLFGSLGPDAMRPENSHAHCVRWIGRDGLLLVADLGLNRVFCFKFDADEARLVPRGETAMTPGFGPRHIELHSDLAVAYVVGETAAEVASLEFDPVEGWPKLVETSAIVGALPGCSAIRIAPDRRWLFVGDRAGHSIARFEIDAGSRIAHYVSSQASGGLTPRDFAFSPDGNILAVANQDSDEVALFRYAPGSGELSPLGMSIRCGTPMSVAFLPWP